ncbi:MAG: zinc-ribbon domain-containing protein [Pirellulales bacterium]
MIIFGWKTRIKQTAHHGQFHCPHCCVTSTYAECRLKTYFHLFFIPVLPLSDDPCGVQCCNCKNTFDDQVLSQIPEQEIVKWKCPECNRSLPETNVRCPICKVRPPK